MDNIGTIFLVCMIINIFIVFGATFYLDTKFGFRDDDGSPFMIAFMPLTFGVLPLFMGEILMFIIGFVGLIVYFIAGIIICNKEKEILKKTIKSKEKNYHSNEDAWNYCIPTIVWGIYYGIIFVIYVFYKIILG